MPSLTLSCKEEKGKDEKEFSYCIRLALALILSLLSGIGLGVSADEANISVAVLSASGNQGSASDSDAAPTPTQDPTATPVPYDAPVEQVIERLNEVLDSTVDEDPNVVLWQLLRVGVNSQMAAAMTESVEVREKMADLEVRYKERNSIQVQQTEMSDAVKEYVDPAKVSLIGASFANKVIGGNDADKTIQLRMDVVNEELKFLPSHSKLVSLGIKLYGNDEVITASLWLPITITMPIPKGIDADKLAIWHYTSNNAVRMPVKYNTNLDGTISFSVTGFSTFAFLELTPSNEPGSNTPAGGESGSNTPTGGEGGSSSSANGKGGDNDSQTVLENQISAAVPGTIITITKDQNINTLSNSVMKQLAKRGDVALEMEYTYEGVDYHIVIPAGLAEDNDIPWYGPLYLSAYYSSYVLNTGVPAPASLYVVQSGDTLSKIARNHNTTVANLTVRNPHIKNVNNIKPGQVITIE